MSKAVVFISHITAEAKLANLIKNQIEADFLGMFDVFVSSDGESIMVGDKWLNTLNLALENAKVMLILCSHSSIDKPWINFEAGAGWIKRIPIVPICHSGLSLADLPVPLNMLQGVSASDSTGLKRVYSLLAEQLGAAIPKQQFEQLIPLIKAFEQEYGALRRLRQNVSRLIQVVPELRDLFRPNSRFKFSEGKLDAAVIDRMKPHLIGLQNDGWLTYNIAHRGNITITATGQQIDFRIDLTENYRLIANQVRIEYI